LVDGKNVAKLSDDIVSRFKALLTHLSETVSANEKCLEDVQLFQNHLKQFRDVLKQNWEALSVGHTGTRCMIIFTSNYWKKVNVRIFP
jgi:predicted metalloenzyme YecM